jgi:hypothetical protein
MTPLQRFRAYMARMSPSGDPQAALDQGLYVPPPGRSVADELATRLELEPASTHLVLGGIGSGKTSELLRVAGRLRSSAGAAGDHIEYCDVSRKHDFNSDDLSGVLAALAGVSLINNGRPRGRSRDSWRKAAKAIQRYASGELVHLDNLDPYAVDERWDQDYVQVPGVLNPPEKPIPSDLLELIEQLRVLRNIYPGTERHAVFLFDSLDRLPSPGRFREAVEHDIRVLKSSRIGVVVVGPMRFMTGVDRWFVDLFDHTHFQLATNPKQPKGLSFLIKVLRRRAEPDLLPDECLKPLARASGGVMRDLLTLAKRAGEEAYAAGHDPITTRDVTQAVDVFGRSLAIGLDHEQLKQLRHLKRKGAFVVRGERELSLLETRRVLHYGQSRWAVHPALVPLLDAISEAA